MIRQLTFDLPSEPAMTRADYFVSPANALALATIEDWSRWPSAKMLLIGPTGAGKSHLAHIWADLTAAAILHGNTLAAQDMANLPVSPICLEDASAVAGVRAAEEALFHLHNLQAERGQPLLLTAATAPRDWGLHLADLASRMQSTALTRLDSPDDALLSALLAKLFVDRQIIVQPALISYLISRMDRSFGAARALVAALDAASLAQRRPITRQLAAEVLDAMPDSTLDGAD